MSGFSDNFLSISSFLFITYKYIKMAKLETLLVEFCLKIDNKKHFDMA